LWKVMEASLKAERFMVPAIMVYNARSCGDEAPRSERLGIRRRRIHLRMFRSISEKT
jgi:hypothetical protein